MLLHCLPQLGYFSQELGPDLLARGQVGQLLLVDFLLHEEVEDEVLVDFGLLVLGGLGEGGSGLDKQILPPADLVDSGVVDSSGPVEGLDGPLACFMVFLLEHYEDFLELVVDLFEDDFVLVVEDLLVLLHLDVYVLDPFKFLLENSEVVLVVAGDVGDGVFAGDDAVVLVNCATVDAVDAEKFPLVLAVEGDEIVVDQAFLGELVLVAHPVQLQACAKVLLPPFQRFYIFCVILL